ncbi:uncharacterized protein LOC125955608 [Anopheles darlingi]|uniref:uncharacterized protein LOC125955608 n=1 Tax=Anopheles darlingi TaxID=43151 RepID=UPI0021003A27|nr:uncharacterized protein LOC125955608 [Anopheles darlingi]
MTEVEQPVIPLQQGKLTTAPGTPNNPGDPQWVLWDKSREFPKNVLRGGVDINDEVIYVGRAIYNRCQLVAKVIQTRGVSYVAFDGKEIVVETVEVLVDDGRYCWEFGKDGAVPETAVQIGKSNNGETLYVGRAIIETSMTPGTILRFKGVLSIPFDNVENEFRAYEVLCYKPEEKTRSCTDKFFIELGRVHKVLIESRNKSYAHSQTHCTETLLTRLFLRGSYMGSQENQIDDGEYKWIHWKKDRSFPENILRAGMDVGGQAIYLGRVYHDGHKLPAKVIPVVERIYTSFDGIEYQKDDAFLLVDDGSFYWEFDKRGNVPETAVKFGNLNGRDVLYVGRALHECSESSGAIYPGAGVLRIPFGGGEVEVKAYYVLCHNKKENVPRSEESGPEPTPPGCADRFVELLGTLIGRIVSR